MNPITLALALSTAIATHAAAEVIKLGVLLGRTDPFEFKPRGLLPARRSPSFEAAPVGSYKARPRMAKQ